MIMIKWTQQSVDKEQFSELMLIKLPQEIYQIYFDAARSPNKTHAKTLILKDLISWVNDKYPGYGILTFEDFSSEEAAKAKELTGINFTWGMYIVLCTGSTTLSGTGLLDSVKQTIFNSQKQIGYANKSEKKDTC